MNYYIASEVDGRFEDVVTRTKEALNAEGFGVLTEIDVQKTLKEKIGADFRRYVILGACNPKLAHAALTAEDKIGVLLPCNVIVQEKEKSVEVAAVDPVMSIGRVDRDELLATAKDVKTRLARVIDAI